MKKKRKQKGRNGAEEMERKKQGLKARKKVRRKWEEERCDRKVWEREEPNGKRINNKNGKDEKEGEREKGRQGEA